ncbi:MAG TPA: NAD-dependent epimerase/dehydratase family protein [Kribbella sp.]|nr:NAD-dependent epimerase/dehydratase family protein [Kribbella sp.]
MSRTEATPRATDLAGPVRRVLVIGATGYIGAAVARALDRHGYEVVAMSRRDNAGPYPTVPGDLTRPETLAAALDAARPDAIVHAGQFHASAELAALTTLLARGVPVFYTSGIWWLGAVGSLPFAEDPPVGDSTRARAERLVLAAAPRVRTVVIRPGVVYGHGDGIPGEMIAWARKYGAGRYVGAGSVRWPTVHVDDLAELFVLAIERAEPGAILHGIGDGAVRVSEIAAAADKAAGGTGRAEAWPVEEAAIELGEQYAGSLALDQAFSSVRTRMALDWHPKRPGIKDELLQS